LRDFTILDRQSKQKTVFVWICDYLVWISGFPVFRFWMNEQTNQNLKNKINLFKIFKNGGTIKIQIKSLLIDRIKSPYSGSNVVELTRNELLTINELTVNHVGVRSVKIPLFNFAVLKLDLTCNNFEEVTEDLFIQDDIYNNSIMPTSAAYNADDFDGDNDYFDDIANTSSEFCLFNFQASMETLLLKNNKFISLESNTFQNMLNLKRLDLSGSDLAWLAEGCLDGLTSLEELCLNNCSIEFVSGGLFHDLCKLKHLNLSHNKIKHVNACTLRPLTALEDLNLNWNMIESIDEDTFAHATSLKRLRVAFNKLELLRRKLLDTLANLELLDLRCNKILLATIEAGCFAKLARLTKLELASTGVLTFKEPLSSSSIQFDTFEGLSQLAELSLSSAKVTDIGVNSFFPINETLKKLDLRHNELTRLDSGAFNWLQNLESLQLSGNRLMRIEADTFIYLTSLKFLDLSDCHLASLDLQAFYGLKSLERLNLSENRISSIEPDTFASLVNLDFLDLSSNQIKKISPSSFHGLVQLIKLNLRANSIESIESGAFESLAKLKYLDLYENKLSRLDHGLFDRVAGLAELDLGSNPISGECVRKMALPATAQVMMTDPWTFIPFEVIF
jgi:Leucine-rich repeat (LRR) protein